MITDENKLNNLIKIFYVIYILNISKKINEANYIYVLHQLNQTGFELVYVSDVEKMIFLLNEKGFKQSYIMTMLLYLKYDIFESVSKLEKNCNELRKFLKLNDDKSNKANKIVLTKNYLMDKIYIVKSFSRLLPSPKNEPVIKNASPKLTELQIRNCFNNGLKIELIERLIQLKKHFKLDILKYMNVNIITYNDANEMNIADLAEYYTECVDTIKRKLTQWICMCDAYLDSEISYLKSLKKVKKNHHVIHIDTKNIKLAVCL